MRQKNDYLILDRYGVSIYVLPNTKDRNVVELPLSGTTLAQVFILIENDLHRLALPTSCVFINIYTIELHDPIT
jgi:hypothetical protein